MYKTLLGATLALGIIAVPASAQDPNAMTNSSAPPAHKTMTTTHTVHKTTMHMTTTHGRMSRKHMSTMKWCKSMSHKRAMRYKSCRALMMRHHGTMHHAMATTHKKTM